MARTGWKGQKKGLVVGFGRSKKNNMENFWIELKETQSGHQILSCQIEGQHWRGFLETREGKRENGEVYPFKSANMRPCSWENCKICKPELVLI